MVRLPRPHKVVHSAEQRNSTRDQNRPVHGRGRDFLKRGPEAEEEDESKIGACKGIVCDTESAGELPWTPDGAYHAIVGDGGCAAVECGATGQDGSGAATVQQQARCEKVGRE